jgi:hypothetical protein
MTRALLPTETEQFLLERVATLEQLHAAIWLSRHRGESVTAAFLARELGMSITDAEEALAGLVDAELVQRGSDSTARYWYSPAHPELDVQMRFVVVLNDQYRADLLRAMAMNAMTRLRRAAQLACLVTLSADVRRALMGANRRDQAPGSTRGRLRLPNFAFQPT